MENPFKDVVVFKARVQSDGRISIPKALRDANDIKPGDEFIVRLQRKVEKE